MAYKCYNKVSESEFHNIVFKRDKLQDLIINKKKLEYRIVVKKMKNQQQNLNLVTTQM